MTFNTGALPACVLGGLARTPAPSFHRRGALT
jgi:hypothetical protein